MNKIDNVHERAYIRLSWRGQADVWIYREAKVSGVAGSRKGAGSRQCPLCHRDWLTGARRRGERGAGAASSAMNAAKLGCAVDFPFSSQAIFACR